MPGCTGQAPDLKQQCEDEGDISGSSTADGDALMSNMAGSPASALAASLDTSSRGDIQRELDLKERALGCARHTRYSRMPRRTVGPFYGIASVFLLDTPPMTSNEIAMMHLLIQRLEDCAAAYVSHATNFPQEQAAKMDEYAKRLLTSAECFRMDLLEEELMGKIGEVRR